MAQRGTDGDRLWARPPRPCDSALGGVSLRRLTRSAVCPDCQRYISGLLASNGDRISEWGGRLGVVVPGDGGSAHELAETIGGVVPILLDPEGKLALGKAMVIVTDEWGEVYFVMDAGAGHNLPGPVQIGDWIRFLAIQCPECEGPEGEWRTI